MKAVSVSLVLTFLVAFSDCSRKPSPDGGDDLVEDSIGRQDSTVVEEPKIVDITPADIAMEKAILYDKYTLDDVYPYRDTTRLFQWDKIKNEIVKVENMQRKTPVSWGVLKNRHNVNGEAPLVKKISRNKHTRVIDSLGTEKYQSAPLYLLTDTVVPEIYALDGSLIKLLEETGSFTRIETVHRAGEWMVPTKYIKPLGEFEFERYAFVDRHNQNITTVEKDSVSGDRWLIRSMNPATTGVERPPYQHETPLGIFVVQEKKPKMYYLVDGTNNIAGFSPHASRFCNGAYIHGVPVNLPRKTVIEWSASLGTNPRSHMCVRNASSHAEFVYDWAELERSLVVIIE